MIRRLFIANRGEIALRIIRTARRMGIETVLGASEADVASLPAQLADHVAIVGPAPSSQGYLVIDRVVAAAVSSGC
ncbi:MAG: acetyl-CoA carboxylase biotin carboxylase subunit, partial [Novosphingobium sp.]|nr:acetyl-CoA carboxylase biotin carboxylase subunit [Novosphingobium sp.]